MLSKKKLKQSLDQNSGVKKDMCHEWLTQRDMFKKHMFLKGFSNIAKIKKNNNKICKENQKQQKNVESLMSRDKIYIIYSH